MTIQKNWQELIRPNKLQVTPGSDASRFATVVAEPLERGFGQTLGNALRRVLLECQDHLRRTLRVKNGQ